MAKSVAPEVTKPGAEVTKLSDQAPGLPADYDKEPDD